MSENILQVGRYQIIHAEAHFPQETKNNNGWKVKNDKNTL